MTRDVLITAAMLILMALAVWALAATDRTGRDEDRGRY